MTFQVNKYYNDLLFIPLGGAGEIGMNVNLYHLEGKWIMADLGAGFADDYLPGVDMIVADLQFIHEHRHNLLGIVLTHSHEDHLGAVQYLWNELRVPVYATPFTAAFLREKLADAGIPSDSVPIKEIPPGGRFTLGPFDCELVQLTHSAPEMNGVMIRTKQGNIFHTGDWKLDPDPCLGPVSDEVKLNAIGQEGVLAMVCDSTNIFSPGTSGSEGALRKSLVELVAGCKKMVVVTTFASNVARMESIMQAAEKAGRRVALAGRSLHRILRAAQHAGYLRDIPPLVDISNVHKYPREEILILATGCQGEPMAATTKFANKSHPSVRLSPEDTVIFSSKVIPGNEKRIFRLFNMLTHMGVEVMTERDHFVHVSGHPNREDVKRMYAMVKPHLSLPVHGELVHMHEHARLAREWGVPRAIQTENGEVIRLAPGEPARVGVVPAGSLAIDGNYLLTPDSSIMRMRRKLQRDGIIIASIILSKKGNLMTSPVLHAPGVLDAKEDAMVLHTMRDEIHASLEDALVASKRPQQDRIEQIVRSAIRRIIKEEVGKTPPIEVSVTVI